VLPEQKTPLVSTVENSYTRWISYHIAVVFITLVALVVQFVVGWRQALDGLVITALAAVIAVGLIALVRLLLGLEVIGYRHYMHVLTKALLVALLLPVGAPLYIVPVTMLIMLIIDRLFKWIFHKAIVHPVLFAVLTVHAVFGGHMVVSETMINIFGEASFELGPLQLLLGTYEGLTFGSTAFLVLGVLWVYMAVTKIVQFRMSIWYLANMTLAVVAFALLTDYSWWGLFSRLLLGYTLFMLVFFVAEPTSTPETDEMMTLYPVVAVGFTVWLRLAFGMVEAAIYALVFAQFATWVIEQFLNRTSVERTRIIYGGTAFLWIVLVVALVLV